MDLIKQLGGYWKAKECLNTPTARECIKDELRVALLEYRRQNNIYEAGDVACYKNHINSSNTLFKFFYNNEYSDIINLLRHATPEEIKAGKRL